MRRRLILSAPITSRFPRFHHHAFINSLKPTSSNQPTTSPLRNHETHSEFSSMAAENKSKDQIEDAPRSAQAEQPTQAEPATHPAQPAPSAPPPFVVRFYGEERAQDGGGRTLDEILKFDDDDLEYHHDFIQVLFPLPERSPVNPTAPLITKSVQNAFRQDDKLREQLFRAFKRLADFYAFEVSGPKENPTLKPKVNFKRLASQTWLTRMDHNHLRITRITRCLRILSLDEAARKFYEALKTNEDQRVSSRSLMYWNRAATRPLHLPPDESDEDAEGIAWLREDA